MRNKVKTSIIVIILLLINVISYSQENVTRFLNIPVDGDVNIFINKLKAKGFKQVEHHDNILKGKFNGDDAHIYVIDNNGKVCRIAVHFSQRENISDIVNDFNVLMNQFKHNKNYIYKTAENIELTDISDIQFNLALGYKQYIAVFYQLPTIVGDIDKNREYNDYLNKNFTKKEWLNFTLKIKLENQFVFKMERAVSNPVWFKIFKNYNHYNITIFYDNEKNMPNGEEL